MTPNDWFFGIDAGGTKTRLYARSGDNDSSFRLYGGPANVYRQGKEETASILSTLINDALGRLPGGTLRAVHAGIAGAGTQDAKEYLRNHIPHLLDTNTSILISITNDCITALVGSFAGEKGLLFIAGTGSGVIARTGRDISNIRHVGGWGYLIGDEGSGYSLGRRAIASIAQALDGGPPTTLTAFAESSLAILDRQSLLKSISHPDWKFQHLAPIVLEAATNGDEVATTIVRKETELLAIQSKWILNKHPDLPPRFTIIGGLSRNEYYVRNMCNAMKTIWPPAAFTAPLSTPVEGAARLAIRQFIDSDVAQPKTEQP